VRVGQECVVELRWRVVDGGEARGEAEGREGLLLSWPWPSASWSLPPLAVRVLGRWTDARPARGWSVCGVVGVVGACGRREMRPGWQSIVKILGRTHSQKSKEKSKRRHHKPRGYTDKASTSRVGQGVSGAPGGVCGVVGGAAKAQEIRQRENKE
jgi:hypothetical protein